MQSACEGMLGINTCSRGGTLNQTTDTLPTQKSTFLKENLSHVSTPCRSLQGLAGNAEQAAKNLIHRAKALLQLAEKLGVFM